MKDETGNGLTRMDDPFCVLPLDADDYIIMVENIDGVIVAGTWARRLFVIEETGDYREITASE